MEFYVQAISIFILEAVRIIQDFCELDVQRELHSLITRCVHIAVLIAVVTGVD